MWKHSKPMLVNSSAIMLENIMAVPFHLHLSCHLWSICMNLVSKIKHQKATFFMKYKYWILVLSKLLRKSWLVFVLVFLCDLSYFILSHGFCSLHLMTGWYWKVKYVQNSDDSSVRSTVLRFQHEGLEVEAEYCCSYSYKLHNFEFVMMIFFCLKLINFYTN